MDIRKLNAEYSDEGQQNDDNVQIKAGNFVYLIRILYLHVFRNALYCN